MNIVERGKAFLKQLRELANRTAWDWKHCPHCGSWWTIKNRSYWRHPWGFGGRDRVRVQRHLCHGCQKTYSETSPLLVRGSWYYREVHRAAVDYWQHLGTSLRRTAEGLRSWMGQQERWSLWRPLDDPTRPRCSLAASTVYRWLDGAGQRAVEGVANNWRGLAQPKKWGRMGCGRS